MFYEKSADRSDYFYFMKRESKSVSGGHLTPPHFHDSVELLVVESGRVEAIINAESKTLLAGDVAFVDKRVAHSFSFGDAVWYSLVFSEKYCRMLRYTDKTLPSYPDCRAFSDKMLSALALFEPRKENPLLEEALASYLLGLIDDGCERVEEPSATYVVATRILEYIDGNLREPITLASVAGALGYSPSYFSSLFVKLYGMSFKDYLGLVRYRRAEEMIESEGCAATRAAELSGFGSMNTFYRARKKFLN